MGKRMVSARRMFLVLGIAGAGLAACDAMADVPATVEFAGAPAALTRLFTANAAKPEWFTPAFLAQVPIDQVNKVVASVFQELGAFKSVEGSGMNYTLHFAKGMAHARVVLDHAGLIAGLIVQP